MNATALDLMRTYRNPLVIASIARLQRDGISCMDHLLELLQHASIELSILEQRVHELEAKLHNAEE